MDEHLGQAIPFRQLQKAVNMRNVAVYASVGHKAVKMERGIMVFAVFHRRQKLRILKEVPVLDGFRDPGQLLIHNAAGAHI